MKRAAMIDTVEQLADTFRQTPNVVLTDYKGMTANQANELGVVDRRAGLGY